LWLVVICWRRRTVLGGAEGTSGLALVAFAIPSGLSGSAPRAALAIALIFLVLARTLYRLGENVERLLDEEPEDEIEMCFTPMLD
jgi:hypothetical protein